MPRLKVVHFITSIDRRSGGTTSYLQLLTQAIAGQADVTIVAGITPNPVEVKGVRVIHVDLSRPKLMNFRSVSGELLDQLKPDILHINGIWELPNTIIQRSAKRRNIPVIISPHGMLEPWIMKHNKLKKKVALWLYQDRSLRQASCLHATAPAEMENIRTLGYTNTMTVIENGISTAHLSLKKSWKRTHTILFLSRINPKKGIEFLIEAIAGLKAEIADYRIIVAGEGSPQYINTLKQKANGHGVGTRFSFPGGVYGDQKWELYRSADLFVLPTHSENFGIVIPEALACGTPVITTVGAPWKELRRRKCGWWIDIGTEPLKKTLREFLKLTEHELEQMGRNGSALVDEKYTAEAMGKKMIQLYKSQLGDSSVPATIPRYEV